MICEPVLREERVSIEGRAVTAAYRWIEGCSYYVIPTIISTHEHTLNYMSSNIHNTIPHTKAPVADLWDGGFFFAHDSVN